MLIANKNDKKFILFKTALSRVLKVSNSNQLPGLVVLQYKYRADLHRLREF